MSLFGHTHRDIYKVVNSIEVNTMPVGVLTVCGSITTWLGANPSYCVYELDKETLLPVSRRTYWFDIDKANETGEADWQLMTDWVQEYEMENLSPGEYTSLAGKVSAIEQNALHYSNHSWRNMERSTSCDDYCR